MPATPVPPWAEPFPWVETATLAFSFVWGAMLGSFLNVVAYRVPRGESVVRGGSRCPCCKSAVRPRDNVPVLGWLLLGGRCRDCRQPIPGRYALVEAACGGLVASLAAAELVGGGCLPRQAAFSGSGIDRLLLHGEWRLLATFLLHASLLLTLVAFGLLGTAGHQISRRTLAIAIGTAGLVALAVPGIHPVGLLPDGRDWPPAPEWLEPLAVWLAGALVGRLCGSGFQDATIRDGLTLVGAVLGWQAVTVVTILTAAVRRASPQVPLFFVPLAVLLQIVVWRLVHDAWSAVWALFSAR